MKKLVFATLCFVIFAVAANAAVTGLSLNPSDAYYVGLITPGKGTSFSLTSEASYINELITGLPGAVAWQQGTETFDRVGSTITPLPLAVVEGAFKNDGTPASCGTEDGHSRVCVDLTAPADQHYTYILGKYDGKNAGAYVWYVPDGTTAANVRLNLPDANKYALSHYSLFNPTDIPVVDPRGVPDGGVTVILLGGALLGVESLRRRLSA